MKDCSKSPGPLFLALSLSLSVFFSPACYPFISLSPLISLFLYLLSLFVYMSVYLSLLPAEPLEPFSEDEEYVNTLVFCLSLLSSFSISLRLSLQLNRQNRSLKRKSMVFLAHLGPQAITEINLEEEDDEEEEDEGCSAIHCQRVISGSWPLSIHNTLQQLSVVFVVYNSLLFLFVVFVCIIRTTKYHYMSFYRSHIQHKVLRSA